MAYLDIHRELNATPQKTFELLPSERLVYMRPPCHRTDKTPGGKATLFFQHGGFLTVFFTFLQNFNIMLVIVIKYKLNVTLMSKDKRVKRSTLQNVEVCFQINSLAYAIYLIVIICTKIQNYKYTILQIKLDVLNSEEFQNELTTLKEIFAASYGPTGRYIMIFSEFVYGVNVRSNCLPLSRQFSFFARNNLSDSTTGHNFHVLLCAL